MMVRVLSFLFLPALLRIQLATAECFYPNGDTDSDHFACTTGSTSVCCAKGFQCLSNGLCADPRYSNFQRVLRGGCTDKGWGEGCTNYCKDGWPGGDEAVKYCGNGRYCCNGDDCCKQNKGIMELGEPSIVATAGESQASAAAIVGQAQASSTPVSNPASSSQERQSPSASPSFVASGTQSDHSASPSPMSTPSPTSTPSHTSTPTPTSTPGPIQTSHPSSNTPTPSTPLPSVTITVINDHTLTIPITALPTASIQPGVVYKSQTNAIALGVGIGVGVGVSLFAALFVFWFFRRRRERRRVGNEQGVTSRNIESMNPFERREYVVELAGDEPKAVEMDTLGAVRELGGEGKEKFGNGRDKVAEIDGEEVGKRDVKTWPL